KKKNRKDVKNTDLWQQLDAVCAVRNIEWNWIKGHAGLPCNEMADQLANLRADTTAQEIAQPQALAAPQDITKPEPDRSLDDPFGCDLVET
ncbi:RNase H family protein, partial [Acinetobacter nosocomialis]|uniref:RNase H family protein n=1 Tax=Acinetobacter nosocomialis TaxID=106654 RepID=UPI003211AC31|nr:DNA polymerase III subunit epsilon [Acinetobacter nosocomialis]